MRRIKAVLRGSEAWRRVSWESRLAKAVVRSACDCEGAGVGRCAVEVDGPAGADEIDAECDVGVDADGEPGAGRGSTGGANCPFPVVSATCHRQGEMTM